MKKIYNQPTCLVVELGSRDALLTTLSSQDPVTGLGVGYGGGTNSLGDGVSADTKGVSDVNLWDKEW